MKTELIIFAVLAMVVSSFLGAESSSRANDNLAATKLRIENAEKQHSITKQIATHKNVIKPIKG